MMPGKRKVPKPLLQYVEDYLESLLYLLGTEEKPEIEVKIEEEEEESLKVRVISIMSDGKKTEATIEVPRPSLKGIPLLTSVTVRHPLELTRPTFVVEDEISTGVLLQILHKTEYTLQTPIKGFDREARRISSLHLPLVSPTFFYSWLRESVKPVSFLEQPRITALTSKHILRLIEIALKLPNIAGEIIGKLKVPVLNSEAFFMQSETKATLTDAIDALCAKAQAQQLKGEGLLGLLIPKEKEKLRSFQWASGEYAGEPILIILPEGRNHLWYPFWIACRELYREVKGAYPEPAVLLEKGYDLWLMHPGIFSGKIVVLHKQCVESGDSKEWFKRRLQEMFSQGLGFLIIISREVDETVAFVKELCKPYIPMIIDIHYIPEPGYVATTLAKVLSAGFGMPYNEVCKVEGLEIKDKMTTIVEGKLHEFPQLDIMVARVDRAYRDFLNELLSSNYIAYVKKDVSERESEDHIAMKVLAAKYVYEKFDVKPEKIICTCEVGDKVIADVYVEEKALAVECETMLGAAPAPLLKIFESVRKYVERSKKNSVNEIWVIVRNWPAILNLGDLLWAEGILREELKQRDIKLKVFVPDIYEKSLKTIDDVKRAVFQR
jgi:hypothetical protein